MDERSPALIDRDGSAFREYSFMDFHSTLKRKAVEVKSLIDEKVKVKDRIVDFVITTSQELDRTVTGASDQDDIYSSPDIEIKFSLGMTVWKKPEDADRINSELLDV